MLALLGSLVFVAVVIALLGCLAIVFMAIARAVKKALAIVGRVLLATLLAAVFAIAALLLTEVAPSSEHSDPFAIVMLATVLIWLATLAILEWQAASPNSKLRELARAIPTDRAPLNDRRPVTPTRSTVVRLKDGDLDRQWARLHPLIRSRAANVCTALMECDDLTARAAKAPYEISLVDWSVFVRRRVPELVSATLENLEGASASDRTSLLDDLCDDLERIGAESGRRLSGTRDGRKTRLMILRRHVANRTSGDADYLS